MADVREFANFREFGLFCARVPAFIEFSELAGRTAAAKFFTEEIKDRFGKADRLPPPLAESTQAERTAKGFSADETLLRTGALRDSISWGHTSPIETVVGSESPIAVYHELGGVRGGQPGRPPNRSFLASTVAEKDEEAFALFMATFEKAFHPR